MPTVTPQYKFKKPKKNISCTVNVKGLRNSVKARYNHVLSFQLSGQDGDKLAVPAPEDFPATSSLRVMLSVKKTRSSVTLGGITFAPVIGCMVIPAPGLDRGMEALHVRVVDVLYRSRARVEGVTPQMYLKSMALCGTCADGTNKPRVHVLMGAEMCRERSLEVDVEDDIWRTDKPSDGNVVNLQAVIRMVDTVLGRAMEQNIMVEVVLLQNM